ncbi:MAG: 6,7-dimethyl-8-ribityllumazine synthase [Pseudomonadota bacterium]
MTEGQSKIAFIEAQWHHEIVEQSRFAFLAELERLGIDPSRVELFKVPGSLEIPLQSKLLAKTGRYGVILAAGLVVDGGIYRHEFVAETVIGALMQVQLETEVPVLSVVLTPKNFHESDDHKRFFFDHFKVKGAEAAQACAQTLENQAAVKELAGAA